MSDGEQTKDANFDTVVKNIQALIDTHLPVIPQIANEEGQNPTKPGTKNRVENLPALRKEVEITEKLEVYFREMVMRLLFEEREEEQLKPRKYSTELRLPLDTITRIISFIPSNNLFTGSSISCLEARIIGPGIPFIAIFSPSLLQQHFDKEYDPSWTLADIASQEIRWSILEEQEATRHMQFDVKIHIYAPTGPGRDQTMIYSLLRYRKHWRALKINLKWTMFLSTMLRLFIPCIPYLDHLEASAYDEFLHASSLVPVSKSPDNVIGASSLKTLTVRYNLLQAFFDLGICKTVTELTPTCFYDCFFSDENLKSIFTGFARGLSEMPCLRELRLTSLPERFPDEIPLVKSQSLRHITINCTKHGQKNDHIVAVSFLSLFVECPIDCIELWSAPKPALEIIAGLFPDLKHLIYDDGEELEILSTSRQNGDPVFPCLERLTLGMFKHGDEDEIRNRIIEIVHVRTRTPGIVPLKMISVYEKYASDSLVEELRKHVPFVEKCKVRL